MKKVLSCLLCLCMVMALFPIMATAAVNVHEGEEFQIITELPTAPGKYCLDSYVYLNDTWHVPVGETTLCLHGKSIYARGDFPVIEINEGRTLNLYDCRGWGEITHYYGKNGSGISNFGTLNMYGGTITGNTLSNDDMYSEGAGIYNWEGTINMYGGTISDNHLVSGGDGLSAHGAGVYNYEGTFNMYGGEITGNTVNATNAVAYGGGVMNKVSAPVYTDRAHFNMYGGTISDNVVYKGDETSTNTDYKGGGVYNNGTFTMSGGTISGNKALQGGGVINNNGVFNMSGGEIIHNIVEGAANGGSGAWGGGVAQRMKDSAFNVSGNAVIAYNKKISTDRDNQETTNNVYLQYTYNKVVTIGEMGSEANIGLTSGGGTQLKNGQIVTVSSATTADALNYFTSDDSAVGLFFDPADGTLKMKMKTLYGITAESAENGSVSVEVKDSDETTNAAAGSKIVVKAMPEPGYKVDTVKYNDGEEHEITGENGEISFVMPEAAVTVYATFKKLPEGQKFSYAYDVQRSPAFPSYESAEMELSNLSNPLKDGGSWYSSSKGEWTLTEVGTFGEKGLFYPAASEYLKGVVDSVARNYDLTGEGLNGTVIHQLTDAEGKHVAYGVVLGYDEAKGYVLFIGDEWGMSGAGYFLSVNEVTEDPVTFMADAIAPSLDKKGFEIDGTMYETFAEAMEAANDGDAIVMHEDMTASDIITIDKNISLIGNDHTIYTSATRGINIDTDGDVLIKNVTIEHSDAPTTGSQNYRTINIINQPANVTIDGVTINSGNNYCVYVPLSGTDVDVTVKNSILNGYSAFTSWPDGVNAEFIDSDLTGTAQSEYIYGVIVLEGGNAKVTVDENCSLKALANEEKGAYDEYIAVKCLAAKESEITINTTDITKVLDEHPVIFVQKVYYDITTAEAENGSVTVDIADSEETAKAEAGSKVVVIPAPADGYEIETVKYNDGEDHEITAVDGEYSFIMPEAAVTVSATFKKVIVLYDITVDATENGSVTVDIADSEETAKAEAGSKVVVIPAPAEGYEIETVKYNDGEDHEITAVDGEYSFIMPEAAVTVSATFKKVIVIPEGEKYSYVYDVFRSPFFPSYENAEMEIYNFRNPVRPDGGRFSSPEGEWILSEMGTYGERKGFSPAPGTNLEDIVEWASGKYNMKDDEVNGIRIHKLTLGDGTHVCYGVVLGVDEENGYVLFIGDSLGWDGAGYFLSKNEITEESIIFTADAVAPSLPKTGFEVNGERYETLEEAMNVARDGDVIIFHEDIVTSETIVIDKNITIVGNGHTIYTTASRGINIDTDGNVAIKNAVLDHTGVISTGSSQYRTINIINKPSKVLLEGLTINSGVHYSVYIPASGDGVNLTVKDSELNGYSAFTNWGDDVVANFINSDLTGTGLSEFYYGVIVLEGGSAVVNVDADSSLTAKASDPEIVKEQYVVAIYVDARGSEVTLDTTDITKLNESDPVIFMQKKECNLSVEAELGGSVEDVSGEYEEDSVVTLKATADAGYAFEGWYKDGVLISDANPYDVTVSENATYTAKFAKLTGFYVNDVRYNTIFEAIAAAKDGDTITMYDDVNTADIITIDKDITLDGNGHTIKTTASRGININTDGNVTIKNAVLDHTEAKGAGSVQDRTINIIQKPATVLLEDLTINSGKQYSIYIPASGNGVNLTVKDSVVNGYSAFTNWGDDVVVNIVNSDLTGTGLSEYIYGVIVIEGGNAVVNVDADSSLTAKASDPEIVKEHYVVVICAAAADSEVELNTTDITTVRENDPVIFVEKMRVEGDNVVIGKIDGTASLILASYNGGVFVDAVEKAVKKGDVINVAESGLVTEGTTQVKAMLWSDLNTFVPLYEAEIVR